MKKQTTTRSGISRRMNPVIQLLILSDTILVGAAGLLGPIFAIFIEDFIVGGSAAVAGLATGIYLFSRSVLQIPIAHVIDRIRGERDDFWLLYVFSLLFAVTPLLYLFVTVPWQLYVVQFVLGCFTAFTYPSYMAIFTRHIDSGKEGTEWSVYFTSTDVASAILAVVGGYIATTAGFPLLILLVVTVSLLGALLLFPVRRYMRQS